MGSQEIPGVKGKFGPGVQNEAVQRLTEFCQENALVINTLFQQHETNSTHGHHSMVNTKIRHFFLCSLRWRSPIQSAKTRLGADCAQIMNTLLPNSDLN